METIQRGINRCGKNRLRAITKYGLLIVTIRKFLTKLESS